MSQYFIDNLHRQKQALVVLEQLQEEEYGHLTSSDPQAVAQVEFSIQELLRQLVAERKELKSRIQTPDSALQVIRDLPMLVDESERFRVETLLQEIDQHEQACARKAAQNAETATALMEQNRALLEFLTAEIKPKNGHTYSQRGKWQHPDGAGAFLRGRM